MESRLSGIAAMVNSPISKWRTDCMPLCMPSNFKYPISNCKVDTSSNMPVISRSTTPFSTPKMRSGNPRTARSTTPRSKVSTSVGTPAISVSSVVASPAPSRSATAKTLFLKIVSLPRMPIVPSRRVVIRLSNSKNSHVQRRMCDFFYQNSCACHFFVVSLRRIFD